MFTINNKNNNKKEQSSFKNAYKVFYHRRQKYFPREKTSRLRFESYLGESHIKIQGLETEAAEI